MESKIGGVVGLRVIRDFRKPGARIHDAGGIDAARFERLRGGSVDGGGYAEVVGMDEEEFCVGRIAEFCLERFGWYVCGGSVQKNAADEGEKDSDVFDWENTLRKR